MTNQPWVQDVTSWMQQNIDPITVLYAVSSALCLFIGLYIGNVFRNKFKVQNKLIVGLWGALAYFIPSLAMIYHETFVLRTTTDTTIVWVISGFAVSLLAITAGVTILGYTNHKRRQKFLDVLN